MNDLQPEISAPTIQETTMQSPETTAPLAAPAEPAKAVKPKFPKWMIGVVVVLILLGVSAAFLSGQTQPQQTQATPTPTIVETPVPTVSQKLSAIATMSAFLAFSEAVASLSATLTAFSLDDGALTPPSLETPINFGAQTE